MFEGWSAKELRRVSVYAIFGYFAFWVCLWLGVGSAIGWLLLHIEWIP